MVARTDSREEVSKDRNFGRVFSLADFDAFFGVITPETTLFFFHIGENGGFGLGKIENPGMGRIKIVGFFEMKGSWMGERESRLDANEESVVLDSEAAEGIESEVEIV